MLDELIAYRLCLGDGTEVLLFDRHPKLRVSVNHSVWTMESPKSWKIFITSCVYLRTEKLYEATASLCRSFVSIHALLTVVSYTCLWRCGVTIFLILWRDFRNSWLLDLMKKHGHEYLDKGTRLRRTILYWGLWIWSSASLVGLALCCVPLAAGRL